MSKNWFKTGEEGIKEKERQDKARESIGEKKVQRFWLKPDESAKIIFLHGIEDAFFCHVHQLKVDGNWNNFATCTADFKPCPICDAGNDYKPTFTAHFTILDLRSYTKKDGTVVKYSKKILPVKGSAILRVRDLAKKYGDLTGKVFDVKRYSANEPNCGSAFDYLGGVKDFVKKYSKEDRTPYDYEIVLAPPTDEELEAFGFAPITPAGSDNDVLEDFDIDDNELETSDELEYNEEEEEEEPTPPKKSKSKKEQKNDDDDDITF